MRVNKCNHGIVTQCGNCFVLISYPNNMASKDYFQKLKAAMKESGKSVEDIFNEMDTDGDGSINGPELYKGVKKIVGETLTPDQISMMIMAIDTNEDNRIGVMELRNALS